MDLGQFIVALIGIISGSSASAAVVTALINRRQTSAQTRQIDAQSGDINVKTANEVVAILRAQMNELANKITAQGIRVDTLETLLTYADTALTYLIRHPGISTNYKAEVERAIRIRRGIESIDDSMHSNGDIFPDIRNPK